MRESDDVINAQAKRAMRTTVAAQVRFLEQAAIAIDERDYTLAAIATQAAMQELEEACGALAEAALVVNAKCNVDRFKFNADQTAAKLLDRMEAK